MVKDTLWICTALFKAWHAKDINIFPKKTVVNHCNPWIIWKHSSLYHYYALLASMYSNFQKKHRITLLDYKEAKEPDSLSVCRSHLSSLCWILCSWIRMYNKGTAISSQTRAILHNDHWLTDRKGKNWRHPLAHVEIKSLSVHKWRPFKMVCGSLFKKRT